MYKLVLKSSQEQIDRIEAIGLEQARDFFIHRKQMDENTFDNLYDVIEEK